MQILHTHSTNYSRGIVYFYTFITLLIVAIFILVTKNVLLEDIEGAPILTGIMVLVLSLFIFVNYRAYRMHFDVTQDTVIIHGVFSTHEIKKSDIKTIQRSPVPFGFRLFGASLLGGLYYIPGVGTTWIAMGNFKDGVLLKTNNKNFFITPKHPDEFIQHVQS